MFWQAPSSGSNELFVSPGAPVLGPMHFCSITFQSWAGYPAILCETGSWVTYCLA